MLVSDTPTGKWDGFFNNPSIVLSASPAAVHRGSFGFRVDDGRNLTGAGVEGALYRNYIPTSGDFYIRYWCRYTPVAPGRVIHSQLSNGVSSLFDLNSNFSTGLLDAEGFLADGGFNQNTAVTGFSAGTWYLVETATLAVGTANGQRTLWVNGQLQNTLSGQDYSGFTLDKENLGEPYSGDRQFLGNLDYDDYRANSVPHGSHFGLDAGGAVSVNGCSPLVVSLLDSVANAPAAAPYAVVVALSASNSILTYYQDSACTISANSLTIPAGRSSGTVYLGASAVGITSLAASHTDFLSSTASVGIGPAVAGAPQGHFGVGCVSSGQSGEGLWLGFGLTVLGLFLRTRGRGTPELRAQAP